MTFSLFVSSVCRKLTLDRARDGRTDAGWKWLKGRGWAGDTHTRAFFSGFSAKADCRVLDCRQYFRSYPVCTRAPTLARLRSSTKSPFPTSVDLERLVRSGTKRKRTREKRKTDGRTFPRRRFDAHRTVRKSIESILSSEARLNLPLLPLFARVLPPVIIINIYRYEGEKIKALRTGNCDVRMRLNWQFCSSFFDWPVKAACYLLPLINSGAAFFRQQQNLGQTKRGKFVTIETN